MMNILIINCGSSSIKYKFFQMPREKVLSVGILENIKNYHQGLEIILGKVKNISCIGHRVVHGAERFRQPTIIDRKVIAKIKDCSRLAPLHNPANLEGIMACKKLLPGILQVAVFDTAFYQTLPDYAFTYALPYDFYRRDKIRKYGFHGTSHEYVAREAAKRIGKPLEKLKIITCHLGNGCSITAVEFGQAIDTSMGFTPLEGLVMGTRCGDIDPALVTYIMQRKNLSPRRVDEILNKESGLKGISGISNDMRDILKALKTNKRAKLALEIFIYRIQKYIGAYIAAMKGVDVVAFTAGISEHNPGIIKKICRGIFDTLKKRPKVMVIATNEELMIARKAYILAERTGN